MKAVTFLGNSLSVLRSFPEGPRRQVGFQIDRLQRGLDPADWRPMSAVGPGVREIRVRDASGAYRAIYVASLPDAVYILHAFQKKTEATAQHDLDVATRHLESLRAG